MAKGGDKRAKLFKHVFRSSMAKKLRVTVSGHHRILKPKPNVYIQLFSVSSNKSTLFDAVLAFHITSAAKKGASPNVHKYAVLRSPLANLAAILLSGNITWNRSPILVQEFMLKCESTHLSTHSTSAFSSSCQTALTLC